MKSMNVFVVLTVAVGLCGCGKSNSGGAGSTSSPPLENVEVFTEGTYRAILRPINTSISGWIPSGVAEILIADGQFQAKSWMHDSATVVHMQNIYQGHECPLDSDANGDGFVDPVEMASKTGDVMIPLNMGLNFQRDLNQYPSGRAYNYAQSVALDSVRDGFTGSGGLSGRVVVVHGADPRRLFPATVAALSGMSPQTSIPIACGILEFTP